MKCQCAVIFTFVCSINLAVAAPPFDLEQFFNELLEMNVRMGDVIQRAKYEYNNMKAKSLDPTGVVDTTFVENTEPEEITGEAAVNEINPMGNTNFDPSQNISNPDEDHKTFIPNESDAEADLDRILDRSVEDVNHGVAEMIQTQSNDQQIGETMDNTESDNHVDVMIPDDVDRDEDLGEETYNNEEEPGWFESDR